MEKKSEESYIECIEIAGNISNIIKQHSDDAETMSTLVRNNMINLKRKLVTIAFYEGIENEKIDEMIKSSNSILNCLVELELGIRREIIWEDEDKTIAKGSRVFMGDKELDKIKCREIVHKAALEKNVNFKD